MNQQEAMFYSAATSRGGRSENQDNFAVGGVVPFWTPQDPESVFGKLPADRTNYFLVADGVGGGAAGADASRLAAQAVQRCWETMEDIEGPPLDALAFVLADAAYAAVEDLNGSLTGSSASTLVLALLRGKDFFVLNIGDSPALLFPAEGEPRVLTEEHNLAGIKNVPASRCGRAMRAICCAFLACRTARQRSWRIPAPVSCIAGRRSCSAPTA